MNDRQQRLTCKAASSQRCAVLDSETGAGSARLQPMAVSQRQLRNPSALKTLEKLSDQLETAEDASEATTKDVQHARRTAEHLLHDVRHQRHDVTTRTRTRAKHRSTQNGKSPAAVELGRKGGTARAKALTRRQRSVLATKAAKTRWNKH